MRLSLILVFLLAIGTVVFALQNPGYTDLQIGPFDLHTSMALLLIAAVSFGAIISSLAMLPGRLRTRKELRHLKKTLSDVTEMKKNNAPSSLVNDAAYDQTDQNSMDSFPASDSHSSSSISRSKVF